MGSARYLNFGAGDPALGWINLDPSPFFMLPALAHVALARSGLSARSKKFLSADYRHFRYEPGSTLPFTSGSLDGVYCSHVLEHLPAASILPLLEEFRRVLAPGGVARIVVPDLAASAERAIARGEALIAFDRELGTLPAEATNSRMRAVLEAAAGFPSFHRTGFSLDALAAALGPRWNMRRSVTYLDSAIERDVLAQVEVPERLVDSLSFELTRVGDN